MLKHSINHYGSLGAPLQSPHPLTSSSHSGDTSLHHHHLHQQINDPTRFIEGPHLTSPHNHSHSHSYLDQSYPSIHNSRLFLESSRISRKPPDDLSLTNKPMNGSIYFSPPPREVSTNLNTTAASAAPLSDTNNPNASNPNNNPDGSTISSSQTISAVYRTGVLRTLSLLSVLSLLLALNSLVFLLKNVWTPGDGIRVSNGDLGLLYEVTLCLTAMSLSINLCVLLICSAQYFFAATGQTGTTSFLEKVTLTRGVAIGGFFLSIPLFLCAIVLYTFTFLSFSPTTLIIGGSTAVAVMIVILFGGCAMIHHVFIWQKEKTRKHALVQGVSEHPTIELSTLV